LIEDWAGHLAGRTSPGRHDSTCSGPGKKDPGLNPRKIGCETATFVDSVSHCWFSYPSGSRLGTEASQDLLVLTRKSNQSIMIGDDIEVSVLSIMGEKVRIGIQAPRTIPVFRKEVYLEIQQEKAAGSRGEVEKALENLGSEEK
jgi:carbon storage regulator